MKKICALLLGIFVFLVALTACGGNSASSLSPPSSVTSVASVAPAAPSYTPKTPEVNAGRYEVQLNGITVVSDYEGNPAVVIDYSFTNNSEETTSASSALHFQVFQNGVELESAFVADEEYDDGDGYKDIRPGASIDAKSVFSLDDTSSAIEVEVKDWALSSDEEIIAYETFDLVDSDAKPASTGNSGDGNSATNIDWKTFLDEYEAWVDDYIALVEKYAANPTDTTILTDYTKMAQEMLEWAEKVGEIEIELEDDPAALAEYVKELARISNKLNEAVALLA